MKSTLHSKFCSLIAKIWQIWLSTDVKALSVQFLRKKCHFCMQNMRSYLMKKNILDKNRFDAAALQ